MVKDDERTLVLQSFSTFCLTIIIKSQLHLYTNAEPQKKPQHE